MDIKKVLQCVWSTLKGMYRRSFAWATIVRLGQNRFLQSSIFWIIFIPIVMRLLSFGHKSAEKLLSPYPVFHAWLIDTVGSDTFTIPFSWKMFYCSAICTALAFTIYTTFCPPLIKFYKNANEFKAATATSGSLLVHHLEVLLVRDTEFVTPYGSSSIISNEDVLEDFLSRYIDSTYDRKIIKERFREGEALYSYSGLNPSCIKHVGDAFWSVRHVADWTLPFVRCVCASLYLLALFFIVFVFAESVIFVIGLWSGLNVGADSSSARRAVYVLCLGIPAILAVFMYVKTTYKKLTAPQLEKIGKKGSPKATQ